jgi:hypothetical protein
MAEPIKQIMESLSYIKEQTPDIAFLKKVYEKDPEKKAALDKLEGLVKYIDEGAKLLGEKDPQKILDNFVTLYGLTDDIKNEAKEVSASMGGDIGYKKNKIKREKFMKYVDKFIDGIKKYGKEIMTVQNSSTIKNAYESTIKQYGEKLQTLDRIVKEYFGKKVAKLI